MLQILVPRGTTKEIEDSIFAVIGVMNIREATDLNFNVIARVVGNPSVLCKQSTNQHTIIPLTGQWALLATTNQSFNSTDTSNNLQGEGG